SDRSSPRPRWFEPSIGRPMSKDKWAGVSAKLSTMSGDGPKSAYELAMERLRQKDKEASVDDRPLTDEQKAAIAEARQFYTAKVAEREILHQAALPGERKTPCLRACPRRMRPWCGGTSRSPCLPSRSMQRHCGLSRP